MTKIIWGARRPALERIPQTLGRRMIMTDSSETQRISIHPDVLALKDKAQKEGLETVWERFAAQQPQCGFCELGLSCRICVMGPCRIDPFGDGPQRGVCGADADIMVARNLGRMVAAGAASHSDHGRDLVETLLAVGEGKAPGFGITDQAKLDRLAAEFGVAGDLPPLAKARELALAMMEEYGIKKGYLTFTRRLPAARLEKWRNLGIDPRGVDWEVTEMMHRTHMGVDNDAVSLLVQALRCALADGWGGSMIATEVSDILFGTPKPTASQVNLAVLKGDQVNLVLHGHSPLVSEMVARAAQDPELLARAQALGAKGINLVGLCCTGNELLMRRGIPMAGNHLVRTGPGHRCGGGHGGGLPVHHAVFGRPGRLLPHEVLSPLPPRPSSPGPPTCLHPGKRRGAGPGTGGPGRGEFRPAPPGTGAHPRRPGVPGERFFGGSH